MREGAMQESTEAAAGEDIEPYAVLAVADQLPRLQLLMLGIESDVRLRLAGIASDGTGMVAVGKLSYGVYLLHMLAIKVAEKIVPQSGGLWTSLATLAATWAVALVLAYAMSAALERPCIALGRRLSARAIDADSQLEPVGVIARD